MVARELPLDVVAVALEDAEVANVNGTISLATARRNHVVTYASNLIQDLLEEELDVFQIVRNA